MQTIKFLRVCLGLILTTGILFSCRKDIVRNNSVTADTAALFSATIDGINWQTDSVIALMGHEFPGYAKIITINGYTSDRIISISLRDTSFYTTNDSTILPGQYTVGNWNPEAAAFVYFSERALVGPDSVWRQQGASQSGSATVTSSDGVKKLISGVFSFTAKIITIDSLDLNVDTLNVSNGVFKNIPYVYEH